MGQNPVEEGRTTYRQESDGKGKGLTMYPNTGTYGHQFSALLESSQFPSSTDDVTAGLRS